MPSTVTTTSSPATTGRVPMGAPVSTTSPGTRVIVREMKAKHKLDDRTALARYALLLLNTNEFVYLD